MGKKEKSIGSVKHAIWYTVGNAAKALDSKGL